MMAYASSERIGGPKRKGKRKGEKTDFLLGKWEEQLNTNVVAKARNYGVLMVRVRVLVL